MEGDGAAAARGEAAAALYVRAWAAALRGRGATAAAAAEGPDGRSGGRTIDAVASVGSAITRVASRPAVRTHDGGLAGGGGGG